MKLFTTSISAFVFLATLASALVSPIQQPEPIPEGYPFKLVATNTSSPDAVDPALRAGHGVDILAVHGRYFLGLDSHPPVFRVSGGSLHTTWRGRQLCSGPLRAGAPIELRERSTGSSDFGWNGPLLVGNVSRGGLAGQFTLCKAPGSRRTAVYWKKSGSGCDPNFEVTFLQAIPAKSSK